MGKCMVDLALSSVSSWLGPTADTQSIGRYAVVLDAGSSVCYSSWVALLLLASAANIDSRGRGHTFIDG